MKRNIWKILAIVFIVIAIIEALIMMYAWNLSNEYVENDEMCAYEICDLDESTFADSYYYDDYEGMCYCLRDREIVKQKAI